MENQGVDPTYISLLQNICNGATARRKLHQDSKKIKLERGAREGDNKLSRLFTECLQNAIFDMINWEDQEIDIDEEHLSHLDLVDNIILMVHKPQELEKMLNDIHTARKSFGLNLHLGKTKVMFDKHATPANIVEDGTTIEQVKSYIYLGRTIMQVNSLLPDTKRRIKLSRAAFAKVDNIMRSSNNSLKVKREIFSEYVLPVLICGSETWALNKAMEELITLA